MEKKTKGLRAGQKTRSAKQAKEEMKKAKKLDLALHIYVRKALT